MTGHNLKNQNSKIKMQNDNSKLKNQGFRCGETMKLSYFTTNRRLVKVNPFS